MKQVYEIDEQGYLIRIHIEDEKETNHIIVDPPQGLYKAKWSGAEWVEGLTENEIDAIKNVVAPKSEIEILREKNTILENQLAETNANLQGFMDFFFENNPDLV